MDSPPKNHIHALTGIRFVAAFGVFVHHILGKLGCVFFNCPFGDGGVTFFFVLSGFILTYVYADRLTGFGDLPRFYFTRWARIWPLHVVMLAVYIFCFMKLQHIFNNEQPARRLIANLFLVQSWIPNYSWCFSFNSVSWSISTEAFFYLMFPLLVLGRGWFWIKYLLGTVGILIFIAVVYAYSDSIHATGWASVNPLVQCFPFVRLFEFMTGIAVGHLFLARPNLAMRERRFWQDSLIEIGAIGLLCAYYHWQFNYPRTVELPQMFHVLQAKIGPVLFYALLIFFFSHTRGIFGCLMGSRIMVYLGEISFAFYMVHLIVIQLLERYDFQPMPMYWGGLFGAALVLSIAAASLLYHFVEVPAKNTLLALRDRGLSAAAVKAYSGFKAAIARPVVWAAAVAIAITIFILQGWSLDRMKDQETTGIIRGTELFDEPIHFANDAVLFGLVANDEGPAVEVELLWVKKRDEGRALLVEVFSQDDKRIDMVRGAQREFAQAPVGELFVERILIPKEKFADQDRLCVAFFSPEEKMAFVSDGPRSFYNQRLDVYTADAEEKE
jgi:peptidoglycan/LPS O-acetylase OafA/YrhL